MSDFRFTSNSAEFKAKMEAMSGKLYSAARDEFVDLQETWVRDMKKEHFQGYYPGKTRGTKLRIRSGHLRSSVGGRVTGTKLGTLRALLRVGGGRAGYARLQEEGGTITPTTKQYLTVPLRQALRPTTGTLKPSAVIRKGRWGPRASEGYYTAMGPTFILNKGGKPLVMVKKGKRQKVVPLYALVKSVTVKPRLGAGREFLNLGRERLPQISQRLLRVLVGTGGAG